MAQVHPVAERTAAFFYGLLFALDPSLRPLFRGDLGEQGRKLMATIDVAVDSLARLEDLAPEVRALGRRHAGYGVEERHYATVAAALIWTLERLLAVAGCAGIQVPDSLKPAANESLAQVVPAKGVQIYEYRDGKWAFVAPDAELFDRAGKKIGTHYAGPVWEAADGSKVIGAVKARADAPQAGSIPWLLLGSKSVGNGGAFSKVTSIQRVATVGGVAPAGACSQPGTQVRIAYTADYYFFTSK